MGNRARKQAAAVPYRSGPFGFEVLLISTRGSGSWSVPKGGIKKGDTAERTARLESLEEAGILGAVDPQPLGRFEYTKRGRAQTVTVLAMAVERVLGRWAEEHQRHRIWVPLAEAPALVDREELAELLVDLRHRLLAGSLTLRRAA